MHYAIFVECTFAFLGFFRENVTFKRFLMRDLSWAGYFKPFFCARVGFNFWHYLYVYFYTLLAFRTGGHLWSLVGNPAPAGNGRQSYAKNVKIVDVFSENAFLNTYFAFMTKKLMLLAIAAIVLIISSCGNKRSGKPRVLVFPKP